jgi:hypothetical protein
MKESGVMVSDRWWWEKWIGNWCFYIGFLPSKHRMVDIRLGGTLGWYEGSVDLFIITFGYSR